MKVVRAVAALCTCAALGLLTLTPISSADTVPDEQFRFVPPPGSSDVPHYVIDAGAEQWIGIFPGLMGVKATTRDWDTARITDISGCSSMQDPHCADADFIQFAALLPYCADESVVDCIEIIRATGNDGKALTVRVVGDVGTSSIDFVGTPQIGLPGGTRATLFTIDGVTHKGGNTFAAVAYATGQKAAVEPKAGFSSFRLAIFAVQVRTGEFPVFTRETRVVPYLGQSAGLTLGRTGQGGSENECVVGTAEVCAVPYALPLDVRFGMGVRVSNVVSGWLHGRMTNASASVSIDARGAQHLYAEANAVRVPRFVSSTLQSSAPDELKNYYEPIKSTFLGGLGCTKFTPSGENCIPPYFVSVMRHLVPTAESMAEFTMWLRYAGDKATAVPTYWSADLTVPGAGRESGCYFSRNQLSGIVATNATAYIAGPPQFNSATQTLDYKVAATHFLPDGSTPFLGTYDLLIRSDVARCVYGFSAAPISATISVLSADGSTQTAAVTSVSEKDGWIHLSASGFTFSTPTVQVKLTQKQLSTAVVPSAKAKTLTCVRAKPKSTLNVTGRSPKCPVGYKKRS